MPWKIRIVASAYNDIDEIKKWYNKQSVVAAEDFIFELFTAIDSLKEENKEHKKVFGNYRRLFLIKFPYTIYYNRLQTELITEIIAVLHNKRGKSFVFKRLPE
jgi:plasmid stabilization system protein ParE